MKERLEKVWEPAVTKHRAEAVKRQLEAAAAVKEMRDSGDSAEAAGAARAAKMRKENADAEVDALNSLDKKFRDSNGGGGAGGDPGEASLKYLVKINKVVVGIRVSTVYKGRKPGIWMVTVVTGF